MSLGNTHASSTSGKLLTFSGSVSANSSFRRFVDFEIRSSDEPWRITCDTVCRHPGVVVESGG